MPRCPATPALLMRQCRGSSSARNFSAHSRTESRSPKSRRKNSAFSPSSSMTGLVFSSFRAAMNTLPPRAASSLAVALPMPLLAPVMRKVLPCRSWSVIRSPDSLSFHPSHQRRHRPRVVTQPVTGACDYPKVSLPTRRIGQRPGVAHRHRRVVGPVHEEHRSRRDLGDCRQGLHLLELRGPRLDVGRVPRVTDDTYEAAVG